MGRKRGNRFNRRFRIEGVLILIATLSIILVGLIVSLNQAIWRFLSFFRGLNLVEWGYTILFCAFLFFLYYLSRVREKQELARKKVHLKNMEELNRLGQIERIKAQNQLDQLKKMDPFEFEKFVKGLYEMMGYKAILTSKTGDGGKDIILKKESDTLLVECKRYNSKKVTRPEIQKFHSALIDMKAKKGFFVTTGEFTKTAIEYSKDKKIELINGNSLLSLLQEATSNSNIGVSIEERNFNAKTEEGLL
ncbi:restriction endonuclease [Bacillus marasmi]|uniref:restriction endonuclease n=1 Tax=Bacillus marasmi TaxID=1926279 RepID=UPI0011CA25C5|nr:restriction endonuclease [Bacillus marasmi]